MKRQIREGLMLAGVLLLAASCVPAVALQANGEAQAKGTQTQTDPPPAASGSRSYVIGNDDLLEINVWKEPELSKSIPVRSDGKISLPLIGDVQAAGKTPPQLEEDISQKLRAFITEPAVAVMVLKINSEKYNILGEVGRPGSYPLTTSTTVMDAIATAGGFRDFAKKKGIYVLRQSPDGAEKRLAFNYKSFIKGKDPKQNIVLRPGDTIVVP